VDFARRKLLGLLSATWVAQACYAVVKVGAIDQLAGGPRTAADLAAATGAHPRVLHRLLRALAAAGVLKQTAGSTYELTSVGELLRADADGSGALMALMHGEEVFRAFADIMHTVDTGEPAFVKTFGMPFYAGWGLTDDQQRAPARRDLVSELASRQPTQQILPCALLFSTASRRRALRGAKGRTGLFSLLRPGGSFMRSLTACGRNSPRNSARRDCL